MHKLSLSVIPEDNFRTKAGVSLKDTKDWTSIRVDVLYRDDHTCYFCGFKSTKYMEIHHLQGRHYNNDISNLITVCPLCHSCLHIGFNGLQERGELLILPYSINQARINRRILEAENLAEVDAIKKSLRITKNLGPQGLIALANILEENKNIETSKYLFFPSVVKYKIFPYIWNMAKRRRHLRPEIRR